MYITFSGYPYVAWLTAGSVFRADWPHTATASDWLLSTTFDSYIQRNVPDLLLRGDHTPLSRSGRVDTVSGAGGATSLANG